MNLDYLISALVAVILFLVMFITILHARYIKKMGQKERDRLLIALAHDMGTPLTVIRGYTEGLLDGVADTEEKRSAYLKRIYGKTIEMDHLLSDMSFYARATSGDVRYDMEVFKTAEQVRGLIEEHRTDYELRGAEVSFVSDCGDEVFIRGDKKQLKRVLENVIENSIKYKKGDHCNIVIRHYIEGDESILSVTDDGKGIRAEELPRIFDDMYRGSEEKGSIRGSGVGLWLVKRIIEDHGGRVWAKSVYGESTTISMAVKREFSYGQSVDN